MKDFGAWFNEQNAAHAEPVAAPAPAAVESDGWICEICDGGPGNACACNCGLKRVLTAEALADREDFEARYAWGGCRCHVNPPCSYCTDPGNPLNQAEDRNCWREDL